MTVTFNGRQVDPISVWSEHVEFPPNWVPGPEDEFSPLVHCPNPDHQTMKRHFQVNLKKPLVHCFANCGISGTYEHAIAMVEGVSHREARKSILKHSRLGKPSKVRKRSQRTDQAISPDLLRYERYIPQAGMDYLASRGITSAAVAKWELGWDADSLRIVIPAKDARNRTRFLIRRAVKPRAEPRYLYPEGSEKSSLLFGACVIDLGMVKSRGIALVEGSIDCIVFDQFDILPVGAILGSKISEIQAKFIASLRPKCIYTFFDADVAGITATISVAQRIRTVPIRVCRYPKGKTDPAELTREEAERSIRKAISFGEFSRMCGLKQSTRRKADYSFG